MHKKNINERRRWGSGEVDGAVTPAPDANGTSQSPQQQQLLLLLQDQARVVGLVLTLGSFIVFAIAGNVLVILSVFCNRHLRTVTNYFIANLALADLLLSTTVLPFSAALEVMGYWAFGRPFCDVWAAVDVLCCSASIMSLCVISVDRYVGVGYPLRYPAIMTERRALFVLVSVWVLSIVISVGPLLGWKEPPPDDETICSITEEPGYALFSSMLSFYIPMCVILGMYCKVYTAAKRQTESLKAGVKRARANMREVTLRIHRGRDDGSAKEPHHLRGSLSVRILKFSREKKAAKTVGIVVGVFVLCWFPFFLVLPLGSYFPECKPDDTVFKIIFWLGYLNSGVNPLIYPCSSQEFKRAFLNVLRCRCRQKHHRPAWRGHRSVCGRSAATSARPPHHCSRTTIGPTDAERPAGSFYSRRKSNSDDLVADFCSTERKRSSHSYQSRSSSHNISAAFYLEPEKSSISLVDDFYPARERSSRDLSDCYRDSGPPVTPGSKLRSFLQWVTRGRRFKRDARLSQDRGMAISMGSQTNYDTERGDVNVHAERPTTGELAITEI
ncbi:unnamed protein product [Lampetra planeri]